MMSNTGCKVFDAKHSDADTPLLSNFNTHSQVTIPRHKNGITDGMMRCELDQIRDYQRINAFLLASPIDSACTKLHIIDVH